MLIISGIKVILMLWPNVHDFCYGKHYHPFVLETGETEAQSGEVICIRSRRKSVAELGLESMRPDATLIIIPCNPEFKVMAILSHKCYEPARVF